MHTETKIDKRKEIEFMLARHVLFDLNYQNKKSL